MSHSDERPGPYHQATRGDSSGNGRRATSANLSWSNGGRFYYWPIVMPPPTPAAPPPPRQLSPNAAIPGPAYMSGGAPYRYQGVVPDLGTLTAHDTGPGPAIVVEAEEPDPDDDTPKRSPEVAVASRRYRRNDWLMTRLLEEQVVDVPQQDFEAVLSLRQEQRAQLEEKLRESEQEIAALKLQQRQKKERWLHEDRAFVDNLRKCQNKRFLMQLIRRTRGSSARPAAPSNKTAFRLSYFP